MSQTFFLSKNEKSKRERGGVFKREKVLRRRERGRERGCGGGGGGGGGGGMCACFKEEKKEDVCDKINCRRRFFFVVSASRKLRVESKRTKKDGCVKIFIKGSTFVRSSCKYV